jgi:hypothetical protein
MSSSSISGAIKAIYLIMEKENSAFSESNEFTSTEKEFINFSHIKKLPNGMLERFLKQSDERPQNQ